MNKRFNENIALLCYREDKKTTEKVQSYTRFNNPLLFAYFNNKSFGFFNIEQFEKILLDQTIYQDIESTKIKLLKDKSPVLNGTFKKNEKPIEYDKIKIKDSINDFFYPMLKNAFYYIESSNFEHYNIIENHCQAICLFKTDPANTNSFATINAHGMAFLNVYQQNEYDEVFFVDDISHQTGHIIMNSFWFERKKHFIINENANIKDIVNNPNEYRSFFILFHALYTYYTSVLCLEKCIDSNCFNSEQKIEASARIVFYLRKYAYDIMNFEKVCQHYRGIEKLINSESQHLYQQIKKKYIQSQIRWKQELSEFTFINQPYNFTFSIFKKENPNLK